MTDRLAAAQTALNAGRGDEAIQHLMAAVAEDPARPASVYRVLAAQLYTAQRYAEGEALATQALERFPRDYELLNIRGVLLRKLKREADALRVLEQAVKLEPKRLPAQQNMGNVLLDLNQGQRAEGVFSKLVRLDPRNAEYLRQLGRSLIKQGKVEPGISRFRQATSVRRNYVDAWLDLAGTLTEEFRLPEAMDALGKAIAANPGEHRLLEAKAMVLRRSGDSAGAEAFLKSLVPANPQAAWLHYQLGLLVADRDREAGNVYLEKAVDLDPRKMDYAIAYIESLERTRTGDEGDNIERAYRRALPLLSRPLEFTETTTKVLTEVFIRVCDYDALDQVGDFRTLGRGWAQSGRHTALLKQIARVNTDADRTELMEQHRIWGREVEAMAARRTIKRPPPRSPGGKIRLGFMSSDLRQHPVGYFAMPLFEYLDNERFEVFVYSYYTGPEDDAQRYITERIAGYRWWPDIGIGQAAERIAADQLDMLIDLGGTTHMNKLEVMAYKPARLQASWLGYPHSAGLSNIDYFICDAHNLPTRPELLLEKPLLMPKSWIALGTRFFENRAPIAEAPELKNGFITYGTANNPHKYTREMLRAWARVVAATPNSRFAFIRPEGGGATFRNNIVKEFAAEGVSEDRVVFHVIRGAHLPYYNEVDITLDTFPLTGGTTTTEALWMGVPVVSLVGPAFYERLSQSILINSGAPELATSDPDEFVKIAVDLANDRDRRLTLRRTLRDNMRNGALGQREQFARDFYDMIAKAVRG